MKIRTAFGAFAVGAVVLGLVLVEGAQGSTDTRSDDPAFKSWMRPEDPGDQTILDYWERAEAGELEAAELVDLGTMLFHRGFPDDALTTYRQALDIDPGLYEAWFRIGFVKHRQGDVDAARQAYKKCLKRRPGHGWCNFYLGLLEEESRHPSKALEHYQRAFQHAPELADPAYNPEVLNSELSLAATLYHNEQERFVAVSPMTYLRPARVRQVRSQYAPTPTPQHPSDIAVSEETVEPPAATTSASGIQGSAKAPQPRERRRPSVQKTPPSNTAFGLPTQQQRPTSAAPTPTPYP